ncbi:MAG: transcriptional repressor [Phycisphaerales bacterium]
MLVPGQADRYEPASVAAKHHHHFRCEQCDRVFDIDGCPGRLGRMLPSGFELTGHEISLWGRCVSCVGSSA